MSLEFRLKNPDKIRCRIRRAGENETDFNLNASMYFQKRHEIYMGNIIVVPYNDFSAFYIHI